MVQDSPVVEAGAILVDRPLDEAPRIAVIQRGSKHNKDWTLPKGHLKPGETLEQAALRELEEETGCRGRILGKAGTTSYERGLETKIVTYFFVLYTESAARPDLDGVLKVEWLRAEEVGERLSYADLRSFFENVLITTGRQIVGGRGDLLAPARVRLARMLPRARARQDRLRSAVDVYSRELDARRARPGADLSPWWLPAATQLLELSRKRAAEERTDAAWDALHASRRLTIYDLTPDEFQIRAKVLRKEVKSKLSGWRRAAALEAVPSRSETATPESLIAAQELLDQHNLNVYLRLRLSRWALPLAAMLLVVLIGALFTAVQLDSFDISEDGSSVLSDPGLFFGVMILGMFGSVFSLALDRANASVVGQRIYELIGAPAAIQGARLAIGGASGIIVVAATQALLTTPDESWVILTAIPAGFSERLVRRSVDALEAKATG